MVTVSTAKLGGIYKRMETDAEFLARLVAAGHIHPTTSFMGKLLDEVGDSHRLQRRIVESEI
jgi:hypothetical protein